MYESCYCLSVITVMHCDASYVQIIVSVSITYLFLWTDLFFDLSIIQKGLLLWQQFYKVQ